MKRYFLLLIPLFFTACLEELEDIDKAEIGTLNPDVAIPIVSSNFTFEEFLLEGNSIADISEENGLILLSYNDTIISQGADSILSIEDQVSPDLVVSGTAMSAIPPNSSQTFSRSATFNLGNSGSDQLDSIWLSAGDLISTVEVAAPVSGNVTITFNSIQQNGNAIEQSLSWSFDGTNSNQTITESDDLAGASLVLTTGGGTNEISFNAEITITNEGSAVSNTDEVRVNFSLSNLEFAGIFGDIASRSITTPRKFKDIDIFNNIDDGAFQLDDPRLELSFINSFGLPVALGIDRIRAQAKDGSFIALSGDVVNNQSPFLLDAPGLNEIGESRTSSIAFNNTNSNLNDVLNSFPSEFSYRFPGQIDPNNTANNFVLAESAIDIYLSIEIPLSGTISALQIVKTFDFDGNGISELNDATMIINTVNTFPIDARLQVYFSDDASNRLDSLYAENNGRLMNAAEIDAQGFSTVPGELNDRVFVDAAKIDNIEQATQLVMRVQLQTANGGTVPIKISPSNNLQVNIGIETELEINF